MNRQIVSMHLVRGTWLQGMFHRKKVIIITSYKKPNTAMQAHPSIAIDGPASRPNATPYVCRIIVPGYVYVLFLISRPVCPAFPYLQVVVPPLGRPLTVWLNSTPFNVSSLPSP
jgi:hypothetical protein